MGVAMASMTATDWTVCVQVNSNLIKHDEK